MIHEIVAAKSTMAGFCGFVCAHTRANPQVFASSGVVARFATSADISLARSSPPLPLSFSLCPSIFFFHENISLSGCIAYSPVASRDPRLPYRYTRITDAPINIHSAVRATRRVTLKHCCASNIAARYRFNRRENAAATGFPKIMLAAVRRRSLILYFVFPCDECARASSRKIIAAVNTEMRARGRARVKFMLPTEICRERLTRDCRKRARR